MPSTSYQEWVTNRASALNELEYAHASVGVTGRGRRTQINHAYTVLLASQFQGYCRDLHSESVAHLIAAIQLPASVTHLVQARFTRGRQLERGNAQSGSLGSDFGRLGIKFWLQVIASDVRNEGRKKVLDSLIDWRNAIAHQDFTRVSPGASNRLRLAQVRRWRGACNGLARSFDEVMRVHLQALTNQTPW